MIAIFVGINITKNSYALFSDTIIGEKTIEVEISNIFSDYLISKVGVGGLEEIKRTLDNSLQSPYNKDTVEYRYRGTNPDNYIIFNDELYRIIGVFSVDNGTGNIENRIKIIKN